MLSWTMAQQVKKMITDELRRLKLDSNKMASIGGDVWNILGSLIRLWVQPAEPTADNHDPVRLA